MEMRLLPRLAPEAAELPLELVEQLLDRVQPRRVLRVQQDVCFHLPSGPVDAGPLVDGCVVHEDDDLLVPGQRAAPEAVQGPVHEVLEEHRVGAALHYLHRDNLLRGHRSDQREVVLLHRLLGAPDSEPGHLSIPGVVADLPLGNLHFFMLIRMRLAAILDRHFSV